MQSIDDIIRESREGQTLCRTKVSVVPKVAEETFVRIAEAMLPTFHAEPVAEAVKALCGWLYQYNDLRPMCGVLLRGKTGRGKTFLMRVLQRFMAIDEDIMRYRVGNRQYRMRMLIATAEQMASDFAERSFAGIEEYLRAPVLCIDDIGAENRYASNFGNSLNVVAYIVNQREQRHLITFGTTNIERLATCYDDRTLSRMCGLFNTITLTHNIDFRRK